MHLDSFDRKVLNLIQTEFPLTEEPYSDMGQRVGNSADELIQRIKRLKKDGIIRLIGPVLNPRRLGYQTTLVAMRVAEAQLEKAEEVIAKHPGVSHGYERDHYFNVWFTLAVPSEVDIERELEQMTHSSGAETVFSLPAIKLFKIGAYFDMGGGGQKVKLSHGSDILAQHVELSSIERLIINELQQDLPLIPTPFNAMAKQVSIDIDQFLAHCRLLQHNGIIRRFSASINHRYAGFTANAMACWVAPSDTIDSAGRKLASLKEVSHCYERKPNPLWPYNLFAMIHCRSRELCQKIADEVSSETGLGNYELLFSTKEFKKRRVKYQV